MISHMTHTPRCQLRRTTTEPHIINGWIETGYSADERPDGKPELSWYKQCVRGDYGKVEEQWWWLTQEDWEKQTLDERGNDD